MTATGFLTKLRRFAAAIVQAVKASIEDERRLSDQLRKREDWQ